MDITKLSANVVALALKHDLDLEALTAEAALTALADKIMEVPAKRIMPLPGEIYIDVTDLPALTLGDRKALKAQGVDFLKYARGGSLEPEDEVKVILFLLQKRRKETTEAEVEQIPAMVSSSFLQFYMRKSAEVDDPFSKRSTSSPKPTAGPSAKSEP